MRKLCLILAAVVLPSIAVAQTEPKLPAGCTTFATTAIPYAGKPPLPCVNHDDHFNLMTPAVWAELLAGQIAWEAKQEALKAKGAVR